MKHRITAVAPPKRTLRLSELSAPRQALVRLCQSIDYGQILDLQVCDREPVFNPPPTLLLDIKLDTDTTGRPESELADFALCDEVCRLVDRLDQMQTGQIQRIEVRAGIARRVLIQTTLAEAAQ